MVMWFRIHSGSWAKDGYVFAFAIVFVCIILRFFVPELVENEAAYLLPSRGLVDPSFLNGKTSAGAAILFHSLVAPLWLLFEDSLAVALAGRLLVWILLLFSLAQLAKELGIKWYAFTIGLVIWLYSGTLNYSGGQSLVAHEWIFGGVEQKCFAYAFVFLSLTSLLRHQVLRAGIFCGISVSSHVLVGGWAAIAMAGALLIGLREYGRKGLITFPLSAAAIALPSILLATRYVSSGSIEVPPVGQGLDVNALYALFANPFHLDPAHFFGTRNAVKFTVFSVCMCYAVIEIVPMVKAKLLLSFLGILLVIFVGGIVARQFEMLWFLKYYPFRVGDLLVPLFFWLLVPGLLIQRIPLVFKQRCFSSRLTTLHTLFTLLISAVVLWSVLLAVSHFRSTVVIFSGSWLQYWARAESPFEEMAHWIRDHTEKSAVVITHPCGPSMRARATFRITAERASVVSFKSIPVNKWIFEWYRRMKLLNGNREFAKGGFKICKELDENFPALDLPLLLFIQADLAADYYLTTAEREELEEGLVHHNEEYYLYKLSRLQHH